MTLAADGGHSKVVKLLLDACGDIEWQNEERDTRNLQVAAPAFAGPGDLKLDALLLNYEVLRRAGTAEGFRPLHLPALGGASASSSLVGLTRKQRARKALGPCIWPDVVLLLLEEAADVEATGRLQGTLSVLTTALEHFEVSELLSSAELRRKRGQKRSFPGSSTPGEGDPS